MKKILLHLVVAVLCGIGLTAQIVRAQDDEQYIKLTGEIEPAFRYISVDGDEGKFREGWWMQEGWAGGIEQFTIEGIFDNEVSVHAEGHLIFGEEDYGIQLHLAKPDVGFLRVGYSQYRKYFDGTGGFFEPFTVPPFELSDDMHLDIGEAAVEVGLTLPKWPRIVLGYEHRFKDGEKSLLEWGSVTEGGVTRKIFPSSKDINEDVNIFKAEIDYDIGPVHLGNRFRYEDYRTVTTRFDQDRNLDAATSKNVTVAERYDHDALYNTFHAESHLSEKVYWSVGYLFTNLEGDASFQMFTTPFSDPFDKNWFTDSVDIDQDSHVVNVNAMVGPFKHVTLYGGFQTEITETDGDTDAVLTEIPFGGPPADSPHAVIVTRTDKTDFEETVGVRYAGIPYTALYAEGRWTQGSIDQFERELEDGALAFERSTDTAVERQRYTAGFNTSPIRHVTLSGRYRHTRRSNDYDHDRDTEPGYSAFITEQALTTDQVSTKLTVRPIAGIKTSVQYQFVATDIDTEADTTPPSSVTSGEYRAHVYTANVTVTPIARLYVTGLFSYRDARTSAFDNGVPSVTTYDGDVYTFIAAAGYAVDDKTDLNVEYLFTYSDNFDDNSSSGLPLGLDHERHGLLANLSRRITKNIEAWLRYGLYAYDEDSNGGVDDYTAHLMGAGLRLTF